MTATPDVPVVTDATITVEMGVDVPLDLSSYYSDGDEAYAPQNLTIS